MHNKHGEDTLEAWSAEISARESLFRGMDKLTEKLLSMTLQLVRSDSSAAGGDDVCVFLSFSLSL